MTGAAEVRLQRTAKQAMRALGSWPAYGLATRGRGYHCSPGDGVFYSYSIFDDPDALSANFPRPHPLSAQPAGPNLLRSAGHVAILATMKADSR